MMMLDVIMGLRMSATGPRKPCKGSKRPQEASSLGVLEDEFSNVGDFEEGVASPFLRFTLALDLEPMVPARARELTPALRALTSSSQYVFWPSAAPFSIGPGKQC